MKNKNLHAKSKCKYCGILYWRTHICRYYINDKPQNNILLRGEKTLLCKHCDRCQVKYLINPITEQYHKTCKIKINKK